MEIDFAKFEIEIGKRFFPEDVLKIFEAFYIAEIYAKVRGENQLTLDLTDEEILKIKKNAAERIANQKVQLDIDETLKNEANKNKTL